MYFSYEEKRAVYCIAKAMVLADNNINKNEMQVLVGEMVRMGCSQEELIKIEQNNSSIKPTTALARISEMSSEKKRYICAFLGALMVVDGEVDDSEKKLWGLVSTFCEFPEMTVGEAVQYMANL